MVKLRMRYIVSAAAMLAFGGNSFEKMLKINVEGTANVVNVAMRSWL